MRFLAISIMAIALLANITWAETIDIPPVEISALDHTTYYESFIGVTYVRDTVTFPSGPGTFSGPGFSAAIGTGDTLIARFEAPAGQKFVITRHPDATSQLFFVNAYWSTGAGDSGSHFVTGAVTFENLVGTAPVNSYSQDGVFNTGQAIKVLERFDIVGDCEFTAIEIEFSVSHTLAKEMRTYGTVYSTSSPSFGTTAYRSGSLADQTVMAVMSLAPTTCEEVIQQGYRLLQDLDGNCRVNLADFALFCSGWLGCNDPGDLQCVPNWP